MSELTVVIGSHFFVATRITPRAKTAVENFARRYIQFGLVRNGHRYERAALRVFAAATADRSEYRFHINVLKDFQAILPLYGLKEDMVQWQTLSIPMAAPADFTVFPNWTTREDQVPVVDYIKSAEPPRSKFVNLQTGKGKSYCSLRAIADLGERFVLLVRPMYIDKWIIDIRKTYDGPIEDLMVIRGSEQLMMLLELAVNGGFDSKMVVISNKTMQNWIKLYEQHGQATLEMGYACTPDRLFEVLGCGLRLIDEVHQDFHLNFKIDLYTHVARSCSLSATLLSDDDFLNKMYEVAYPAAQRYNGGAYDKYIAAKAVMYRFQEPNKIRTMEYGSKTYSHHAFEKSLIRNRKAMDNYLIMIDRVLRSSRFGKEYKGGDKALIYCASIDFCTIVTNYLRDQHPTKDVRRYVEEDPYDNLMEPDIRVTTLQSAGTGVDIPGLVVTIVTNAIASSQSNIQGFGRLRALKDDTIPEFYYFVCEDIQKHIDYHERKKDLLKDRALTFRADPYGMMI